MSTSETSVFLAAVREELERHLTSEGYQRSKHQQQLEDYGHFYSVFEKPERIIRFIWDGREGTLTFRIYSRRNWGMKLMRALVGGTAGDERLLKEVLVRRHEIATLTEEEMKQKLLEALNDK